MSQPAEQYKYTHQIPHLLGECGMSQVRSQSHNVRIIIIAMFDVIVFLYNTVFMTRIYSKSIVGD